MSSFRRFGSARLNSIAKSLGPKSDQTDPRASVVSGERGSFLADTFRPSRYCTFRVVALHASTVIASGPLPSGIRERRWCAQFGEVDWYHKQSYRALPENCCCTKPSQPPIRMPQVIHMLTLLGVPHRWV